MERGVVKYIAAAVSCAVIGCSPSAVSTSEPEVVDKTQYVVAAAPVPPGVVRYCWEEPMVTKEPNGPGLNSEGTWYSPSYKAVRMVRGGKWRPCNETDGASDGGTK